MSKFRFRSPLNEEGQAVIIVALFLSFVFLALAALAIDGSIVYLRRRQLQNIADAAALTAAIELGQLKTEAEAYQAAMESITANKGRIDWYSTNDTPNPPATNVGSGLDLVRGIEISGGCDVRVSLRWSDIGTYFAQFVGRSLLQVGANAHAGCNRAGGLVPIAVKRFGDEFDVADTSPPPDTHDPSTIYCETCNTQLALPGQGNGKAYDFLRPMITDTDVIVDWPGWPANPDLKFESPSPHADLSSGAPGREYFIIGSGVAPNVSTAGVAYAGLVNLDLRDLSSFPTSFNGVPVDAQTNTLKDYAEYYIRRGYCCDIPAPGDQVAAIAGVSNDFAAGAFQETYAISDVLAVIVYDGHIHKDPDLDVNGTPDELVTYPTTTTLASSVLNYNIELDGDNNFSSALTGMRMNVEGLEDFADWNFSPTNSPVLPYVGSYDRTLTLQVTPTLTTVITTTHVVTGVRIFYASAIDDRLGGTNVRRYWAGIAAFGDGSTGLIQPGVTALPDKPYITLAKGDPAVQITLEVKLWGLSSGNYDVTLSAPGSAALPTGFSWRGSSPPWVENGLRYDRSADIRIRLEVDDTAIASSTPYAIPLTVSSPGLAGQTFNLYVLVKEGNATTKDYVVILGYAALQITDYPNVNSVRGRIVSPLWDHPSEMKYGLRARLIPWDQ